jgi:DNA-directed RNA polymerase subunit E"
MAKKERACKNCRTVFEGQKCPACGSVEFTDSFKGKIFILNPENSEIAQKLKLAGKGTFAIRLR